MSDRPFDPNEVHQVWSQLQGVLGALPPPPPGQPARAFDPLYLISASAVEAA
jgi:hypothetical protein